MPFSSTLEYQRHAPTATTAPSAPVVVLLHGLFGHISNLNQCANALRTLGFETLSISLPGHGHSPLEQSFDFIDTAQQLEQLRQHLDIKKWSLVGHSLGGKVAMTYAQCYPNACQALVVADIAPVAYERRHDVILKALSQFNLQAVTQRSDAIRQLEHAGVDAGTAAFICKHLVRHATPFQTPAFSWQLAIPTLVESYPAIIAALPTQPPYLGPVLLLKGQRSDYLQDHHRAAILARFPKAKAHIIAGAGHMLHVEKTAQFNTTVGRFLLQHVATETQTAAMGSNK
ncbi:MAG: alpha/beta fold hydrolase [Ferrimonas sp.]